MSLRLPVKSVTDKPDSACVVLPVQAGQLTPTGKALDARLGRALTQALRAGDLPERAGATLMLRPGGGKLRILLVSAGAAAPATEKSFFEALRAGLRQLAAANVERARSSLHEAAVQARDLRFKLRHSVLVAREISYRFDAFKSKPDAGDSPRLAELALAVDRETLAVARSEVDSAIAIADGIELAKNLGNTPGNVCHPVWLAEQARALARRTALKCEVLDERRMAALGMGALLAVAQGSAQPPRLIVLRHEGAASKSPPIVLVGKGITFDTGGISLKPAPEMDEMKYDMSGAGTVLGVMQAVDQAKLKLNVIGVIAAAENMPSGTATRPGDIVTTLSGQTVEILNTDAEGRLVLCDALTYVERFKPAAVIDIATLTGACVIALGHHHAGLFANDDALSGALVEAGRDYADTCWPLPLDEVYQDGLKSPFADMANIGGRPGGAITAACFLARYTRNMRWAHLDIAGVAWRGGQHKGSTGRPVGLLSSYLISRAG